MAPEPAYVAIAGKIAKDIRSGKHAPGTQLPSRAELAAEHGVSDIVIRNAVGLLRSQGLVRTVERRGIFVAERPTLVRVAPERQTETPETSFGNEAGNVHVERERSEVEAPSAVCQALGLPAGTNVGLTVTRVTVDGQPASISDSYEHLDVHGEAVTLEETLAYRLPSERHARWLAVPPSELVVTVHQRFLGEDDQPLMVVNLSYPRDRYDAFVFRMAIPRS